MWHQIALITAFILGIAAAAVCTLLTLCSAGVFVLKSHQLRKEWGRYAHWSVTASILALTVETAKLIWDTTHATHFLLRITWIFYLLILGIMVRTVIPLTKAFFQAVGEYANEKRQEKDPPPEVR